MPTLSQRLYANLPDGFFRPLARPSARVYVDCADVLVEAAGESGRVPLLEARALIQETVSLHPVEEDDEAEAVDVRVRAGKYFNQMLNAGWIEDRPESLHERWIVISPVLRPLMDMLRELAADNIRELKSFADTLEGVCRTLEAEGVLDPLRQNGEELRSTVSDLNARLSHAITQLHSVEKVVHGFEQRQMQTRTGAETLQLFYGDFYEGQHMVCHDVLHRRGLLSRLQRARVVVREAADNPFAQERLAEGLTESGEDAKTAWLLAGDEFFRLLKALSGIRQRADAVDARIASFHQLSRQRFFYQSQMRGRRPEMARQLCEAVNREFAGKRFSDLDGDALTELLSPWRGLLTPEVECLHGTASLRSPRRMRQPVSLSLTDSRLEPPDETELARLREHLRVALTPERAARLVRLLLPEPEASIRTDGLTVASGEMFLDLVAAASFDHALTPEGTLRWRVTLARDAGDLERAGVPYDDVGGWDVERFTLTRTK
jgi:hypothetical protein